MAKQESLQAQIRLKVTSADQVSRKRNGNILLRKMYFYGISQDGGGFADKVMVELGDLTSKVKWMGYGNHFANFKGGSSIAKSSHYWVELELTE